MDLSSHPSGPWKTLLLTASFLTSRSLPCDAQLAIYPSTRTAIVGQDVLLSVHGIQRKSQIYSWFHGLVHQNLILSYNVSSKSHNRGPGYTGREVLYKNASLLIRNIKVTDGRLYTFQEVWPNLSMTTVSKHLQVYQMVSKPHITANTTSVTEDEDSVAFQCLTKDDGITILWFLNNQPIPPSGRLSLSKDNRTLTVLQTRRADAGMYQCEVWNEVSTQSSDHITLAVTYGPDQVKITQEPGSHLVHTIKVKANSTLTLRCQAESHPSARFDWLFNDSVLVIDRDELMLQGGSLVPGHYTCVARNSLTKNFAVTAVYIEPLIESPDTSSGGSRSSLTFVGILVGILVVMALLSVLAYLLRKKAQGYSQEVLGGPGQKNKILPSVKNSDVATYENGLQLQHQPSNRQMSTPPQDVNPYSILSPDSLEDPYEERPASQDSRSSPVSVLSSSHSLPEARGTFFTQIYLRHLNLNVSKTEFNHQAISIY
ncbi:cell adhesion molecule CEACAM6-like isoform X2 [Phascolarctos cinereus]|uniref:Carcinoembryonic antigen-related cell adhesion molecule 6-like isoform X2 n=1 Tax=Phascolarctos cinereus TaxID=38626 RepID=A0A6P5LRL6_PHACI|nr:carcinoembryonic antigen-related cell adhesion molecule 6-like isoform X2 [Phascolarctos cinereus]